MDAHIVHPGNEVEVLPPCLHSLKQFQTFLLTLTRNCVGLLPLWIGQGPLKLSLPA